MKIINSTPQTDGYHMPAEFERHKGTIMIWPVRPGSWPNGGIAAKKVFTCIARRIALHERMYMLVDNEHMREAEDYIFKVWDDGEADTLLICRKVSGLILNLYRWNQMMHGQGMWDLLMW